MSTRKPRTREVAHDAPVDRVGDAFIAVVGLSTKVGEVSVFDPVLDEDGNPRVDAENGQPITQERKRILLERAAEPGERCSRVFPSSLPHLQRHDPPQVIAVEVWDGLSDAERETLLFLGTSNVPVRKQSWLDASEIALQQFVRITRCDFRSLAERDESDPHWQRYGFLVRTGLHEAQE